MTIRVTDDELAQATDAATPRKESGASSQGGKAQREAQWEADGGEDDAFPSGGHRSRRGAVGGAVGAVSVLGGIAAIESFCDFTVPFIYGISGLWDYLVSVGRVVW